MHFIEAKIEYEKDKNLKKEDVDALINWVNKQPHLPQITELQAIFFLQSCYYSNEAAKTTIDAFFTMRTQCPDLFRGRNPSSPQMKKTLDNSLATVLPKKTPQGDTIVLLKLMSTNPENFNFIEHIKYLDMICMLQLHEQGTSEGYVIVSDMKGAVLGHLAKVAMIGPSVVKKFLFYLQEALPVRLKAIHFVNIVAFMDKVLALMKPFLKIELLDKLYLHNNVEDLAKFMPIECLPEDYGGSVEATTILHENIKSKFLEYSDFFQWEDTQVVDESKRPGTLKSTDNVFGIAGTFKKLEID